MIAGTASGGGKTTISCAILSALKMHGKNVVSFKCGPDYVDPTFHRYATEVDCYNLDSYLMGEDGVVESLGFHSRDRDIVVMEGVMGFYDGIGRGSEASSHHLSRITGTPVLLVVDTKGKGVSICAEIRGFQHFEENNIAGIILNRTKTDAAPYYRKMIEEKTDLRVVGFLPEDPESHIDSRHLGLIPAGEIPGVRDKIFRLGQNACGTFDFDILHEIAAKSLDVDFVSHRENKSYAESHVRIYVARDEAFCFHYADNHRILESFGAELAFFSPMRDPVIPDDADGLIFWGGYPELHAATLATNESLKESVRKKHAAGLPIFAECGGFMYMQQRLIDRRGNERFMAGVVEGTVSMTDRLQQFGYVELTANTDNMLCRCGEKIRAHSFHYSRSTHEGNDFNAVRASGNCSYPCIVATEKFFAGYPHLHFAGNRNFPARFVDACLKFKESK